MSVVYLMQLCPWYVKANHLLLLIKIFFLFISLKAVYWLLKMPPVIYLLDSSDSDAVDLGIYLIYLVQRLNGKLV